MDLFWILIALAGWGAGFAEGSADLTSSQDVVSDEYCQFQALNVTCGPDEVLLMQKADYGRMEIGRCVTSNYGYIGCRVSVLDIVDKRCSGNRSCVLQIADLRDLVQPCPKDLTVYLEAKHTCVKVVNPAGSCAAARGIETSATKGYISSLFAGPTSPGIGGGASATGEVTPGVASQSCPLHIHANTGQYINLTVFNFGQYQGNRGERCPYYAVVEEDRVEEADKKTGAGGGAGAVTKNISLCAAGYRMSHLYTSKQSSISFYFGGRNIGASKYLVQYTIGGCATMQAPPDGWVERTDNKAVIRCNHSKEVWYLTCEANKWLGSFSNCSDSQPLHIQKPNNKRSAFPYGLVVAITIGVVLGVAIGTVMLISVFIYRRRRKREQIQRKPNALLSDHDGVADNEENYARRPCLSNTLPHDYHKGGGGELACTMGGSCCVGRGSQLCGDYTQMMELRCATPCSTGDIYAERRAVAAAAAAAAQQQGHYNTTNNRHVSFAGAGTEQQQNNHNHNHTAGAPIHAVHAVHNIPTSFATFKPQTDLEPTYDRGGGGKRVVVGGMLPGGGGAPHRTYPVATMNQQQRGGIGPGSLPRQMNGPRQSTPPPPPPPPGQQHQQHLQQQSKPSRAIHCDYSLFNSYDDSDGGKEQPDLVSSNHVDGGQEHDGCVVGNNTTNSTTNNNTTNEENNHNNTNNSANTSVPPQNGPQIQPIAGPPETTCRQ